MNRREFIAGLGSAVTWPLAAQGQQGAACAGSASCRSSAKTIPLNAVRGHLPGRDKRI
jgi:hypothetical protein